MEVLEECEAEYKKWSKVAGGQILMVCDWRTTVGTLRIIDVTLVRKGNFQQMPLFGCLGSWCTVTTVWPIG